ncbi:nitrate reductase cytochrome c-type subunit [Ferrimonas balearica]|uniref:nitrate reductase cytochrome c-type subunit n=1 Tax=Ferrimonas balearica TaxID=44012 RepID=UPI001C990EC4|nr:nitrate reductase cytochrome c-type subunit [Ferrimonas balearica]MBY5992897.1 nitrate reductase cytochrome c-type subunit [Ferrimonas balearica]
MSLKPLIIAAALLPLWASAAEPQHFGLRADIPLEQTSPAPGLKPVLKESGRKSLNYVNQPPLVPHKVQGYQITQSTNRCLQCHDVDNYLTTGAPRVSPTHFTDRDGVVQPQVAPRRYLCLQCHVTQADVTPPVANDFTGLGQFAKD